MRLNDIREFWCEIVEKEWRPVAGYQVIGVALFSAYIIWQHFFTIGQWVFLLDNANLAIHEAGHPIAGMLSNSLMFYGGTLFQLMFPAAFAGHFWRQRHSIGWGVTLIWLGENLLNVGRYMSDARAHNLPLVGGGDHDWTAIFSHWGVLAWDTRIGGLTRFSGFCLILWALFWLGMRWHKRTKKPHHRFRSTR